MYNGTLGNPLIPTEDSGSDPMSFFADSDSSQYLETSSFSNHLLVGGTGLFVVCATLCCCSCLTAGAIFGLLAFAVLFAGITMKRLDHADTPDDSTAAVQSPQ